jgi:hypothetical protein
VADGRRSRVVGADDERTSYGEAESA